MTDTREVMEMAQQPVAYLAWCDGKPCYEGEDVVCADPVWPVDADDDRTSMPVYAGAAPAAQSDDKDLLTIAAMDAYQMGKRDALAQQGEQRCDTARVLEWMRTPNRKAAQFAFTEGQERQAAYWIEIAQGEPAAQPDARKVIEQMAGALENAVPTNWSNSSTDEHRNAIQAGQKWLEENMAGDGGPHAIESAHGIIGGAG